MLVALAALLGVVALAPSADAAAASADLVVSQTANPQPGGALDLVISVTNQGPSRAVSVVVHEVITGKSITRISHTSNVSTACRGAAVSPDVSRTARTCRIAALPAGKTWSLTFTVSAPTGTPLDGAATASAKTSDPGLANNSSSVSSWAGPVADLSVSASSPTEGRVQVSVTNNGPNTAPDVSVSQDDRTVFGGGGDCTTGNLCLLGKLAPGATVSKIISATSGHVVDVSASPLLSFDPNGENNKKTVTVK